MSSSWKQHETTWNNMKQQDSGRTAGNVFYFIFISECMIFFFVMVWRDLPWKHCDRMWKATWSRAHHLLRRTAFHQKSAAQPARTQCGSTLWFALVHFAVLAAAWNNNVCPWQLQHRLKACLQSNWVDKHQAYGNHAGIANVSCRISAVDCIKFSEGEWVWKEKRMEQNKFGVPVYVLSSKHGRAKQQAQTSQEQPVGKKCLKEGLDMSTIHIKHII